MVVRRGNIGESPSQYNINAVDNMFYQASRIYATKCIGSSPVVSNKSRSLLCLPTVPYSILQRENYYNTYHASIVENSSRYNPIVLEDSNNSGVVASSSIVDIDGNVYTTVVIGNQEWMVENLKTTRYADGTAIPNVTSNTDWLNDITGAYCWYNNDISYKSLYGATYNWYAVNNIHGLAPTGWRIPDNTDWTTLALYLNPDAGGKLKETGTTNWTNPNTGATNETGFTALPSGERQLVSANMGNFAEWWSTSEGIFPADGTGWLINHNSTDIGFNSAEPKYYGFAVRCVRDYTAPVVVTTTSTNCSFSKEYSTNVLINSPVNLPVTTSASLITDINFNGNWHSDEKGIVSYYLDVSTDAGFTSYVPGYKNLKVGNVETYEISGLLPYTPYYYRVRYDTNSMLSGYSNTTSITTLLYYDGTPTSLTSTAVLTSQINLSWVDNSADEDGFNIYRSTDNIIFTLVDTITSGLTSYSDYSLDSNTRYYYKITAYRGIGETDYSNTTTSITGYSLGITSAGDGTGVTSLNLEVTSNITLTIDGNGKFYSNSAGTLGESNTWSVTSGAVRTLYMKCTSGTALITFSDTTSLITLGGYGGDYVLGSVNSPTIAGNPFIFTNLTTFNFILGNTFALTVTDLPTNLINFTFSGSSFSGSIADIPASITSFTASGANTLTGNISTLKSNMALFSCLGSNTISGNISDISSTVTLFTCGGLNTITGDLSNLKPNVLSFSMYGNNTITGNISSLVATMQYFVCSSAISNVGGSLSDLPSTIVQFEVYGAGTVTGNLSSVPATCNRFSLNLSNTVTGDINNFSSSMKTILVAGSNTVSGNLSSLHVGLTYFYITGSNTITGNVSSIPSTVTFFYLLGNNTVTGSINDVPVSVINLALVGQNTVDNYTAGKTWSSSFRYLVHTPAIGSGLSSTEVDNLLIDLSALPWSIGSNGYLVLTGGNAPRTSASDAAVASISGKGVHLTTN